MHRKRVTGKERKERNENPLTVAAEREGVVFLPGGPGRDVVVPAALSETTVLLSDACKATCLPPLVHGLGDPVNFRIPGDSLVVRVNEDNFIVLVHAILVNPVRVEDAKITAASSNTLLSGASETTLEFEVVNTLADGLAVGGTLGNGLFPVTAADTDTVDEVTLLGLVSKSAGLVGSRWAGSAVDHVQLAVFPAPHAEEETKNIGLLLLVQLADVLVGAHSYLKNREKETRISGPKLFDG